jgi:hypothetical protein
MTIKTIFEWIGAWWSASPALWWLASSGGTLGMVVWSHFYGIPAPAIVLIGLSVFSLVLILCRNLANRPHFSVQSATWGIGPVQMDVTQEIRARIRDGRLALQLKHTEFDRDPCPGKGKELILRYSFGGMQCQVTLPENSVFEMPRLL